MKKPTRVTVYPLSSAGGESSGGESKPYFRVTRIDNAVSFQVPSAWSFTRQEEMSVGRLLSHEYIQILSNNPDFEVSCVERPQSHYDGSARVVDAVEKLGGSLTALQVQVSELKFFGYALLVAVGLYAFFRK